MEESGRPCQQRAAVAHHSAASPVVPRHHVDAERVSPLAHFSQRGSHAEADLWRAATLLTTTLFTSSGTSSSANSGSSSSSGFSSS